LACVPLLWLAAVAQAGPLPAGAAACLARMQQAELRAADAPPQITAVCPAFAAALGDDAWADTLSYADAGQLGTQQLRDLIALSGSYSSAAPSDGLDAGRLDAIVSELAPFELPPALSLWDRVLRWLEERLGGGASERLADWLRGLSLPAAWRRALVLSVAALLVAAVGYIVFNELRHATRRHGRLSDGADAAPGGRVPDDGSLSVAQLERAAPARRPALLLALILRRLRLGGAPIPASCTHRELAGAVDGLGRDARASLAAISGAAERVAFGGWRPDAHDVEPVLARGRELLGVLQRQDQ
jgi:hypothetical protein